ncbi:ABC transporter substrate-binding protein [Nitratireductor sp. ZSWI3]|uniref:ABC transporter substrate-binding protein n=1 Tax=Nitratireductor sp. ZSWI3 TaxID=2966359 RepID=UPI0021501924|nr:ABC transporter substrate-binding protein [Nitratireductor sp. ZSWI3]MCR4268130.1 ABC transporter substrate-binding protein [Nitratireductor sp. ZSWI3]
MPSPSENPLAGFISRRSLLRGTSAALAAAMLPAATLLTPGRANAAGETVMKMQLGWLATNAQLGELAAEKLGYFAEEGLALELVPGGPNIDGVANVYSGAAQMGQLSSSPSLLLARSAGIPVKCVAVGLQQHPFAYFSLPGNPIHEPKDMIGKKIGTNGTARILLRALLAANDIPEDQVEIVVTGGNMSLLLDGQVDAMSGWATNVSQLTVLGEDRVMLRLWDSGVQLYANPFYVTDETLEKNFDQVAGFVRAAARGWGWVNENREAAIDILMEKYPNFNREDELASVDPLMEYAFNDITAANGWGSMDPANWQRQIETYEALGGFEAPPPKVEDVVTMSVLEATAAERPKIG